MANMRKNKNDFEKQDVWGEPVNQRRRNKETVTIDETYHFIYRTCLSWGEPVNLGALTHNTIFQSQFRRKITDSCHNFVNPPKKNRSQKVSAEKQTLKLE